MFPEDHVHLRRIPPIALHTRAVTARRYVCSAAGGVHSSAGSGLTGRRAVLFSFSQGNCRVVEGV